MVYSQLLDRPSISRMQKYLNNTEILRYLNIPTIKTEDLYSSRAEINDADFTEIEKDLLQKFLGLEGDRNAVVIHVTDTYFTGDSLDSRPRKGKEEVLELNPPME